jgi:hypothetical protein
MKVSHAPPEFLACPQIFFLSCLPQISSQNHFVVGMVFEGCTPKQLGVRLMLCGSGFIMILDSLIIFKSVEICRILSESLRVFKSVEICRFLVSGWTLPHQCWLLAFYWRPPTFDLRSCFLNSDGPSNFDSSL